ncbi:tryptophan synthase subunit alpha [Pseudogracilibacillus auburnensis]|uniref:tryptophan synthase n=1 Tax=Pseudogracilibacillus auburnensis TaxID=1494959 RepID=A0A2V3W745_9BACI|nr:tryptophan synthase subunit alpha [Pseudogracilibacillus auburnensis]MBO1001959.1 tryptophan synthase subunit alpha [Pseudogracilibacillus auburnensis]PXW90183.1 tryptophan synthase alpha chain [Pseudogracilibacillus auburnensis]
MGKELTTRISKQLPTSFITTYFVGGHPTKEASIDMIEKAVHAGVNAIEIGFPSKNPFLDGETIKRAHREIAGNFSSLTDFIDYLKLLRSKVDIPLWIMGYEEDLLADDIYIKLAKSSYIDGFIIPNLPIHLMEEVQQHVHREQVEVIPVINDQMSDEDIQTLIHHNDVVYCQLYTGKTGNSLTMTEDLPKFYERMRKVTDAKLMAGFGIKNRTIAEQIFHVGYDGIVIGSEIVRLVSSGNDDDLVHFIHELEKAKDV